MTLIARFNPHDLSKKLVDELVTGRDAERAQIAEAIDSNMQAGGARTHLLVTAPRGFGKSFLMRLTQIDVDERRANGQPVAMVLLPEEQMNISAPDLLLKEIRRVLLGLPFDTVIARWDRTGQWAAAAAELDQAIDQMFGPGQGLVVAVIENLDELLKKAFPEPAEQALFRRWLNRSDTRVMVIGGSARCDLDHDPARPLFLQFTPVELHGWSEADCVAYLGKLMKVRQQELTPEREAKARAIATFIGGNPRLSVILGDVLLNDDALTTAELLDKLVDELTPYYQDRIQSLGGRAQNLLDALLRGGEPCSQSALADRVGARQSDIARAFRELQAGRIVVGDRATDGKETLYRVEDRVFAHYYRKRHLLHGQEYSPFEAIAEFLKLYFNNPEKREQAMRLALSGKGPEARFLLSLADQEQAPRPEETRNREGMASELVDRCLIAIGRMAPEWRDLLAQDMDGIGRDRTVAADICTRLSRREVPESLSVWHRLLMAIAHYLAGDDSTALQSARRIEEGFLQTSDHYGQVTVLLLMSVLYPAHTPESLTPLQAALKIVDADRNVQEQELVNRCLTWTFLRIGQYRDAIVAATRTVELASRAAELDTDHRRDWIGTQAIARRYAAVSHSVLGQHNDAVMTARDAAERARQADRPDEQVLALMQASFSLGELGQHEEAVATAREAAELALQANWPTEQAVALRHVSWSLGRLGRYGDAVATAVEAAELAHQASRLDEQAIALRNAAWSLGQLGRHEEAAETAVKAAELARHAAQPDEQAIALRVAGTSLGKLGQHEEALATSMEAAELAQHTKQPDEQVIALRNAALSLLRLGRYGEAALTAESASTIAAEIGDYDEQAECLRITAASFCLSGQHEAAIKQAREAFALAAPQGDHFVAEHALFWLLESAAVLKRDDDVRWAAEQCLHLLSQLAENDEARRHPRNLGHLGPALLRRNRWADDLSLLRGAWPHFDDWEYALVGEDTAAAAVTLSEEQGRATAYAAIASCVRALASGGDTEVDFTPFLDGLLDKLAAKLTDAGLLKDLAGLLRDELPPSYATRAALMEAAALFHAAGRDPAALQRVDPDIALAIRRVWMPEPAKPPPSTPKRRTGRKKKG